MTIRPTVKIKTNNPVNVSDYPELLHRCIVI